MKTLILDTPIINNRPVFQGNARLGSSSAISVGISRSLCSSEPSDKATATDTLEKGSVSHDTSRDKINPCLYLSPNDKIDSGPSTVSERIVFEKGRKANYRRYKATIVDLVSVFDMQARAHRAREYTYKLPIAKVTVNPIFKRVVVCKFHTTRIGTASITMSVTIFGMLPQMKNASLSIQTAFGM